MPKDPVCLSEFELRDAGAMRIHDGRAYYFCSDACKQRFKITPDDYTGNVSAEKMTIGIMGSAASDESDDIERAAHTLGQAIADHALILISGACPGLPYLCAQGARQHGGLSIGISPALSLDEHIYTYHSPVDAFDVIIYTGSGLMGREVTNIRSSDIVLIAGGRSGTLGEFAIAYDEGKLIGVLEGSGGITDTLPAIIASIDKETGARVIYDAEPVSLIERLLENYEQAHYRKPSCFCGTHVDTAM